MNYITIHQVKQQLKLLGTVTDDAIFNNWIGWSCGLIDWWKGRRFDIRKATLKFDTPLQNDSGIGDYYAGDFSQAEILFNSKDLYLNVSAYDLLEVVELLNGDGTVITAAQYILEPANSSNKNRIRLKTSSGIAWLKTSEGDKEQAISLTGFFGYSPSYPDCFVDTNEKITAEAGFPTNQNTFVLQDNSESAADFVSPRVQEGNMLRLKSNLGTEFLYVQEVATDDYGDTVTVVRHYNGTTAYAHPKDTVIEVFRPHDTIVQMALRLVQWRYRQKDQDNFDRTYNLATQTVTSPTNLPADVRTILGKRRPSL